MLETWVWFLGWEDPLEEVWLPATVFLRGESPWTEKLVGYSPWGHKKSDMTGWLSTAHNLSHSQDLYPEYIKNSHSSPNKSALKRCHKRRYCCSVSHVWLFVTPWTATCQASLYFTISQSLLKLMSIESVMPSNHLVLCSPLLLLPWIFPSIRVFSNELALHIKWTKYWSFSFSISPSNEYSGLISFRMDWFDLLAGQGTLKSLLQHQSSKASILWHSAFLMAQLSHPYMTTGKTIALTRRIFVGKVTSLLFNMLSRLVIAFLPKSKRLNFMAAVTFCSNFGAQENKVCHCFHCFPIYLPWSDGTGCHDVSLHMVNRTIRST